MKKLYILRWRIDTLSNYKMHFRTKSTSILYSSTALMAIYEVRWPRKCQSSKWSSTGYKLLRESTTFIRRKISFTMISGLKISFSLRTMKLRSVILELLWFLRRAKMWKVVRYHSATLLPRPFRCITRSMIFGLLGVCSMRWQ